MKAHSISQNAISVLTFAAVLFTAASAVSAPAFTDWATVNLQTHLAVGDLHGVSVSMSGDGLNYGITDGSFTGFSWPLFSPQLPASDTVGFGGTSAGLSYNIAFAGPVRDPVLHLRSLGSTLTFNTTNITKLSGDPALIVAGNTVVGFVTDSPFPGYDANGSIRLNGLFSTLAFTAAALPEVTIQPDGIYLQLGGVTDQPRASIRVSQVELCWDTILNNGYQLEYRSSLTTNLWTPLGAPVYGNGLPFCTNDNILRGESSKSYRFPPGVESTFDKTSEGWSAYGNGTNQIQWEGTNGHPGGCIVLTEGAPINGWFEAPAIYCGDKSGFYGGTLRYDIYPDSSTPAEAEYAAVQFIGATNTLQFIVSNLMTRLPAKSWTNITIPLLASTNWTINGAKATNVMQFRSILANLRHLRIDGDLYLGTAGPKTSLDNVRLTPHPGVLDIRASQVEISWNSYSNRLYSVQYRSELTTNIWTDLFSSNILATASETCILDDIPRGRPQRYYRVLDVP